MTEKTYTKPDLYLFIQSYRRQNSDTVIFEVHIVKYVWDEHQGKNIVRAVDAYDFSNDGSFKETRYFEGWSPNLRYYPSDGKIWNHSGIEYTDVFSVSALKAERMHKTLRSFERGLEKIAEQRGDSRNYVESIMRFGELCKVVGLIVPDKNDSYGYKFYGLRFAKSAIERFAEENFGIEKVGE